MSKCKVLSVVSQKGGVGKTNVCTNLGVGLAQTGHKVLIIDVDSQASQTISLGWRQPDELQTTIATTLKKIMNDEPIDISEGVLHHAEGIDLMPSSIELSGMELQMINAMSRETILKSYIDTMKEQYSWIIIDCPPTLGIMTVNALAACNSVLIPVVPEYLSVVGMTQLFDTISTVKRRINPDLRIEGIVFTLANMHTNVAKNTVETISNVYGGSMKIYSLPIPFSVRVKEAGVVGQSIYAYHAENPAAYAYMQLTKEVLRDAKKERTDIRDTTKVELAR